MNRRVARPMAMSIRQGHRAQHAHELAVNTSRNYCLIHVECRDNIPDPVSTSLPSANSSSRRPCQYRAFAPSVPVGGNIRMLSILPEWKTCLSKRALSDDFDCTEVGQLDLCPPESQMLRFRSTVFPNLALLCIRSV